MHTLPPALSATQGGGGGARDRGREGGGASESVRMSGRQVGNSGYQKWRDVRSGGMSEVTGEIELRVLHLLQSYDCFTLTYSGAHIPTPSCLPRLLLVCVCVCVCVRERERERERERKKRKERYTYLEREREREDERERGERKREREKVSGVCVCVCVCVTCDIQAEGA